MTLTCPTCSKRLEVADEFAANMRRKTQCPSCQAIFRLAEGSGAGSAGQAIEPTGPMAGPSLPPVSSHDIHPEGLTGDVGLELELGLDASRVPPRGAGGAAGDRYEIDRDDYQGSAFEIAELEDLIKRGWVMPSDRLRTTGTDAWVLGKELPALATAFMLRKKTIQAQLTAMARKSQHPCENHPKKRASHICLECARAFCRDCGNSTELGDQATVLCLDCDAPMAPSK